MQREKNTEFVLQCFRETGWTFQNLIVWKKKTSAVPGINRYGKHYQIIAFATKGKTPRVFNRLRIDPPLPADYKHARENGMYVTDVWDDIRELTSGYFAGDEALRDANGNRLHKQQTPIQLLLRIILSSTNPGDVVLIHLQDQEQHWLLPNNWGENQSVLNLTSSMSKSSKTDSLIRENRMTSLAFSKTIHAHQNWS